MKAIKGHYFPYGLHVPDHKHLSKDKHIETMPLPEVVTIALAQSLGRPALPCVAVGDKVKTGEIIAKADGLISSDVFSSVSGEVTDVTDIANEVGGTEKFIVIKSDGLDEKFTLPPLPDPTPDEIKTRIKDAGIVGLGGASFPTYVKANPRSAVDTLILNGAECEPYLTCDHRAMIEMTDRIVRGARYLAKALGIKKILVGIELNKPDCIAAFEEYDDMQPVALKKQYPMGSEKHLIYVCTKRKVPLGKLPADVGCIVENVATCYSIADAIEQGTTLYERILTVSGKAITNPKNLLVRVGTDFDSIVAACGGLNGKPTKIVRGGPMTGTALINNKGFTRKATSGLLYLDSTETAEFEPTPCLSCGRCADVCPMRLMPMQTALYAEAKNYEKADKYGGAMNCISCGSCAYVCPAKRPLLQNINKTKIEINKQKQKLNGESK